MKKLWYFAHPYSSSEPDGRSKNFHLCNQRAVQLLDAGYHIFSPISHSHPLQGVARNGSEFWLDLDASFMQRCDGLILAPGWETSKGCRVEQDYFSKAGKPILHLEQALAAKSTK